MYDEHELDKLIASGRLQRDWLAHYEQVKMEVRDLEPEESMRVPVWDFFWPRVGFGGLPPAPPSIPFSSLPFKLWWQLPE